jgi:hypothetical protein
MTEYTGWDDYQKHRSTEHVKHKGDLLSRIAKLESWIDEHHQH